MHGLEEGLAYCDCGDLVHVEDMEECEECGDPVCIWCADEHKVWCDDED